MVREMATSPRKARERRRETVTVSLPPQMLRQLHRVRKLEKRTPSELILNALQQYLESRYPVYTPTKAESAAIRKGREAFERGEYVALADLVDELGSGRHQTRKKRTREGA